MKKLTVKGDDLMANDVSTKQVLLFIYKAARPFPFAIFSMVFMAFIWAVDLSVRPYLLKVILNLAPEAITTQSVVHLIMPVVAYLFMSFLFTSTSRLYGYFAQIKMIPKMRQNIATECFDKLLSQSHQFYQNNFSGSLSNKINDLAGSIPDLIQIIIDTFLSIFLALTFAIYTLWQVNVAFAVGMIIWAGIFIVGSLVFSKKFSSLADKWSECSSTITGKTVDIFSNILAVRLFAHRDKEQKSFAQLTDKAVIAERKLQTAYFWQWFVYGYTFIGLQAVSLYFLLKGQQEGTITLGDFALVLTINTTIVDFLWTLTKEISQFSKHFGRTTQALRTILITPEMQDEPNAPALQVPRGVITFESVKFNYKDAQPLFNNKTITIKSGEKVGLVGFSGSGKSTFVNLILRLFDVTDGRILIDNQDIKKVTRDSLRLHIGMIPQDPSLFHTTLINNIRYGKLDATDEEIIEAAKKASAHEFIQALPEGYNCMVGERGVKISGGQRQRIAIARAILKNAPILILDEATSQLDSITENSIQESLWNLMQGKTTLVIAHRLSTLLQMDRILVFDKGQIVEDGSHQELLVKNGLYKTLWNAQVGGFLPGAEMYETDNTCTIMPLDHPETF